MPKQTKSRLKLANARGRKDITVRLMLKPADDVSAFSCSVNYPQDILEFLGVEQGSEIRSDENEAFNTNDRNAGTVGVGLLIDGVDDLIASQAESAVAIFRFRALPGAPKGKYAIFFDNTPAPCSVSNSKGALLPCDYITGFVTVP